MPFAQIYLLEGASEEKKRLLIEKMTQAIMEVVQVPPERVRVAIVDMPATNWGIGGKTLKELLPSMRKQADPDQAS
ncbi:MAG: 4-oxalocrotonate tautomerase [Herminiimonas sp.]|jgi:4-oxalocrotonate tautomerase|nr:4-oxalocrotonate tautomerase [Herminiimonas sp.]